MNTNTLKRALISEKSFTKAAESKFTFIVENSATKDEVTAAVEELFGVNVVSINTINIPGKVKRSKKGLGKRSDIRKAIVTLKKGQKIDLFEVEEPKEDKKVQEKAKKESSIKTKAEENTETTVKVREKKK